MKLKQYNKEKEIQERAQTVCSLWKQALRDNPEASSNRIMATIAEKMSLTVPGVRGILERNGICVVRNKQVVNES